MQQLHLQNSLIPFQAIMSHLQNSKTLMNECFKIIIFMDAPPRLPPLQVLLAAAATAMNGQEDEEEITEDITTEVEDITIAIAIKSVMKET